MNCEKLEGLLMEYLDGVLDPAGRATVETHLANCAGCRERVEGFRKVSRALDAWEAPEVSPWFNTRLRQRIAASEASAWAWLDAARAFLKPSYALALAVVALAGTLAIWQAPRLEAPAPAAVKHHMDEIMPVVEDYEILANFEVLGDLKQSTKDTKNAKM